MVFQAEKIDSDETIRTLSSNRLDRIVDSADTLEYSDYGMVARVLEPTNIPSERQGLVDEFNSVKNEKQTNLQTRQLSVLEPLSLMDWTHFIGAVRLEAGAIGYVQVLPIGHRSVFPFKNNLMSILPCLSQSLQHMDRPIIRNAARRILFLEEEVQRVHTCISEYEKKLL